MYFETFIAVVAIFLMAESQAPISPAPNGRHSDRVLELPKLTGPELPPISAPINDSEIPSPFLGCWVGNPKRFDSVVSSFGSATIGAPGKIIFCYRANRIEVPEADISLTAGDWVKNVALHLGLGVTTATVDTQGISSSIYEITASQIHARTFIPLNVTERLLYVFPVAVRQTLTDEELVTLISPDLLIVQARQALAISGMKSVRMWHAEFHRIGASAQSASLNQ